MNDVAKIGVSHLARAAYVYLRQSSPAQVEHNRESTQRQYALVSKATALGWKNRMRENRTSGTVRGEGGNILTCSDLRAEITSSSPLDSPPSLAFTRPRTTTAIAPA
jgi:hypothetical protein